MNTKNITRFLSMLTIVGFLLTACGGTAAPVAVQPPAAIEAPVVEAPAATEAPAAATSLELTVVTYEPPAESFGLISEDLMIGVSYNLTEDRPYEVITPAQSVSTIAGGTFEVDTLKVSTDKKGTVGNIVTVVCRSEKDPCKNTVKNFVAGNVNVTTVFAGNESPNITTFSAVSNMFKLESKNCGDAACLIVNRHELGGDVKSFKTDSQPAGAKDMDLEPFDEISVQVAVVGAPEAKTVLLGQQVVGHRFESSGDKKFFGVSEGSATIVECPTACVLQGVSIAKGNTAVLFGSDPDANTPADLNWTAKANGQNMIVTLLTTYDYSMFLPDNFTAIYADGSSKEMNKSDLP
ncbi:MAG: hypothetical protein AAB492_02430 [Patescibacteria group bacterium]